MKNHDPTPNDERLSKLRQNREKLINPMLQQTDLTCSFITVKILKYGFLNPTEQHGMYNKIHFLPLQISFI